MEYRTNMGRIYRIRDRMSLLYYRIAIDKDEPRSEEFERELSEQKAPSTEIEAIPIRMIL